MTSGRVLEAATCRARTDLASPPQRGLPTKQMKLKSSQISRRTDPLEKQCALGNKLGGQIRDGGREKCGGSEAAEALYLLMCSCPTGQ